MVGNEELNGEIKSLCVFSGSRVGENGRYREAAVRLGEMMAERGIRMIYGGGNIGLMGLAASAVLQNGGEVVGVIPEFLMSLEVGDPGVTELVVVETMHQRKARMYELSDGFVVLPGGLGTLDETLEIATWKQLQLHTKPIVALNIDGFWKPLSGLLEHVVSSGFAHPAMPGLISTVDTVEEVFGAALDARAPDREILLSHLGGD
ncbi:MAG: TIGR00730 family Rossman fold protein [Rhodospirillales bacterium]|nr:TIGR00730 family Rossman fold protein [Rhodospirillales bacterium]